MAKTYTLQGPIILQTLTAQDALTFAGAVIDAIPSYSMGTASLNIKAQGPASTGGQQVSGASVDALKASLETARQALAPHDASDIVYDVRGAVNLVGLSLDDGIQVIDAAMHAIPDDSLVIAGMVAQESQS
jgi:hypothetical protein